MAAEQLEEVPILLATVTSVISQLKNQLQQQYEQAYPGLADIVQYVIDEEEANAWALSSLFPHLFLPDLIEAHIAQLGLQPVSARPDNVLAPRSLLKSESIRPRPFMSYSHPQPFRFTSARVSLRSLLTRAN